MLLLVLLLGLKFINAAKYFFVGFFVFNTCRCLKKYCVCFSVGKKCDFSKCRCTGCGNYEGFGEDETEGEDEEIELEIEIRPPASFVRVPARQQIEAEPPIPMIKINPARSASTPLFDDSDYEEDVMSDKRIDETYKLREDLVLNTTGHVGTSYMLGFGSPLPIFKNTQIEEV